MANGTSVGQATTDQGGSFSAAVTIPTSAQPGPNSVTATDVNGGSAVAALTITGASGAAAASTSPTGSLPRTGTDTVTLAGGGVLLVLAGGLMVVAARRRRTTTSAS